MFTATSLERLSEVHPELKRRIIHLDALLPSLSLQVTQGYRSIAQQNALYAMGRTQPGTIVTNAKGGYSSHQFGYAADLCPEDIMLGQPDWDPDHPAWKKLLLTAPACGLAEGAMWRTFTDRPHFYLSELPADPTDAMRALLSVSIEAVWNSWAGVLNTTA